MSVVVDEISDRAVTCPVRHSLLLADSLHDKGWLMVLRSSDAVTFQKAHNFMYKKQGWKFILIIALIV